MISLNQVDINGVVIIEKLDVSPALKNRMISLGLLPGTKVKVIRRAPLGDPIEIWVRHYGLSLRHEEASNIYVIVEGSHVHG